MLMTHTGVVVAALGESEDRNATEGRSLRNSIAPCMKRKDFRASWALFESDYALDSCIIKGDRAL